MGYLANCNDSELVQAALKILLLHYFNRSTNQLRNNERILILLLFSTLFEKKKNRKLSREGYFGPTIGLRKCEVSHFVLQAFIVSTFFRSLSSNLWVVYMLGLVRSMLYGALAATNLLIYLISSVVASFQCEI